MVSKNNPKEQNLIKIVMEIMWLGLKRNLIGECVRDFSLKLVIRICILTIKKGDDSDVNVYLSQTV
jgi:hypothetical protein